MHTGRVPEFTDLDILGQIVYHIYRLSREMNLLQKLMFSKILRVS